MTDSRETQIDKLKLKIANAKISQRYADNQQQEDTGQRRIDSLELQLKELES